MVQTNLKVESYFLLKSKAVDKNDPSKGFFYTYSEHFTEDVYRKLVSIQKEYIKKMHIEETLAGKISCMIASAEEEDVSVAALKWEQTYATALGYKRLVGTLAKTLRNVKKTRNRLNSICRVICNIYNSNEDVKKRPFEEVAADFKIALSIYRILDDGRMVKAGGR